MDRILRVVLVCIFIVCLTGTYFGCAGSSERDSASKKHQHSGGGGHSH